MKSWNDDKGLGFIRPEQGGAAVFAHISAMRGERRAVVVGRVLYVATKNPQGRARAERIRLVGELLLDQPAIRDRPNRRLLGRVHPASQGAHAPEQAGGPVQNLAMKPMLFTVLCSLPLCGALQLLGGRLWLGTGGLCCRQPGQLLAVLAGQGERRAGRLAYAGEGAAPGRVARRLARRLARPARFRHKTRKVAYQLLFWTIVAAHQAFWVDWLLLDGAYVGSWVRGYLLH